MSFPDVCSVSDFTLNKCSRLICHCLQMIDVINLSFDIKPIIGTTFYNFIIQPAQVYCSTGVSNVGTRFHYHMMKAFLTLCFGKMLNQISRSEC